MEVRKTEISDGSLTKIEFIQAGEEDFKDSIRNWLRENQPGMTYEEFFTRLIEFRLGYCSINMA